MKEYIKLFQTPTNGDGYKINDIPFSSTVKSTNQNLVCNLENKKLKKVEDLLVIENATIVIPSNEIWYTSSDRQIVVPQGGGSGSGSGSGSGGGPLPEIVSNTYVDGKGIMRFAENITDIGDYAFKYCGTLTSVEFPDSVTSIGYGAFSSCSGLTSITIPDSVTSICQGAFAGCTSLSAITIPSSVTSIGDTVFASCSALTSVIIPDSVTSIGTYTFSGCTSLSAITIPSSVTSIGANAFNGCTSLTRVDYDGTTTQWSSIIKGSGWKRNVPSTCKVYCSDGIINI